MNVPSCSRRTLRLTADEIAAELYEDNKDAIVEEFIAALVERIEGLSDEEKAELFGGTVYTDEDVVALYEANKEAMVEEFLDIILAKYGTEPAPVSEPAAASYEEESAGKTPISVPVFGEPTVGEDATADEYMNARDAARSAEIARLLEFIDR